MDPSSLEYVAPHKKGKVPEIPHKRGYERTQFIASVVLYTVVLTLP